MDQYEKELYKNNIKYIAGVDEVGRGPLVGPVVSACVVLPKNFNEKVNDSKKLSEKKRNHFFKLINEQSLGIGIGIVSPKEIDEINIYQASKKAMIIAINECLKQTKIDHVLIDAMKLDIPINSTSIIKGDAKSYSIASASIIAKVTRDNIMYELDKLYPQYNYKKNKGYPTKQHIECIKKYNINDNYRKTYKPVKEIIDLN